MPESLLRMFGFMDFGAPFCRFWIFWNCGAFGLMTFRVFEGFIFTVITSFQPSPKSIIQLPVITPITRTWARPTKGRPSRLPSAFLGPGPGPGPGPRGPWAHGVLPVHVDPQKPKIPKMKAGAITGN